MEASLSRKMNELHVLDPPCLTSEPAEKIDNQWLYPALEANYRDGARSARRRGRDDGVLGVHRRFNGNIGDGARRRERPRFARLQFEFNSMRMGLAESLAVDHRADLIGASSEQRMEVARSQHLLALGEDLGVQRAESVQVLLGRYLFALQMSREFLLPCVESRLESRNLF